MKRFHRIVETQNLVWVGRDLTDHLGIPTTLPRAGTHSTGPVCSKPFQPGLERFQGRDIHSFSGQPAPVPHYPQSEEFFLIASLNLSSFSLKPLPLVLSLQALVKCPFPAPLQAPSGTERLL